jgi:hypothetical protein
MKASSRSSQQPTNLSDELPVYPDIERLVTGGDLTKIGAGYSVQTEAGFDAISHYIVGLKIGKHGKPTVYRLSRKKA